MTDNWPYYADDSVTLYHGDALAVLQQMPDASVDAVVTDPPYGLEFMGREWDSFKLIGDRPGIATMSLADGSSRSLPVYTNGRTNPTCRNCGGTQRGQDRATRRRCACDAPDFPPTRDAGAQMRAFQQWCEAWAREALRVLKPGGHLLAFGGTRTVHRLTCAIEDAGFEIRDGIDWIYGSGFPKSLDVSKAIDKAKRRDYVLAAIELGLSIPGNNLHDWTKAEHSPGDEWWERFKRHLSPEDWQRIERKVIGERDDKGRTQTFGGGESRRSDVTLAATDAAARWSGWGTALKPAREPIVVARKPLQGTVAQTVLAYGTGALNVDGCRVEGEVPRTVQGQSRNAGELYGADQRHLREFIPNDAGRWPSNVVLSHAATPDGADLCGDGCVQGCPVAELDQQSGVLASGKAAAGGHMRSQPPGEGIYGGGRGLWTEAGNAGQLYGDSGGASRYFPVFRYEAKADAAERPRVNGVAHPTVKPLDLMRWLVRLVTPPGGTVADFFAGSGTTGEACLIEGFPCILAEREPDYLPLIVARLSKPLQPVLFGEVA